jgi:hypothetical protein
LGWEVRGRAAVKVRRRPGAALRIQKATERVIGKFCALHERKQVERLIRLDVHITCCGGVLMAAKGAQRRIIPMSIMGETRNGRRNANTNIEFDAARKTMENFDRNG